MTTTWKKLRSGEWGVIGSEAEVRPDAVVTVTKKSGEAQTITVGRVIWRGDGKAMATVATTSGALDYRNGTGRMHTGRSYDTLSPDAQQRRCDTCRCHQTPMGNFDGCDWCGCDGDI